MTESEMVRASSSRVKISIKDTRPFDEEPRKMQISGDCEDRQALKARVLSAKCTERKAVPTNAIIVLAMFIPKLFCISVLVGLLPAATLKDPEVMKNTAPQSG